MKNKNYSLSINTMKRSQSPFYDMRIFHNWIKRQLIEQYIKGSNSVLDLASGKGGDIFKYLQNGVKKVIGFDINKDSVNEAIRRYHQTKKNYKDTYYRFYVKDLSKETIKAKADNGAIFFAIHYFAKNKETLNKFIQSFNGVKGYVVITTFDGNLINNDFDVLHNTELKGKNYTIKKTGNNTIAVEMKTTVLDESTEEYLLKSEDLIEVMDKNKYTLVLMKNFREYYPEWEEQSKKTLENSIKQLSFYNNVYVFKKN